MVCEFVLVTAIGVARSTSLPCTTTVLGFSCEIRATFAAEAISLESIADLEAGDFKEAGVRIGDRPMLKQAAAMEFASMQGVQMFNHLVNPTAFCMQVHQQRHRTSQSILPTMKVF